MDGEKRSTVYRLLSEQSNKKATMRVHRGCEDTES